MSCEDDSNCCKDNENHQDKECCKDKGEKKCKNNHGNKDNCERKRRCCHGRKRQMRLKLNNEYL